jgi:hypothetical protein
MPRDPSSIQPRDGIISIGVPSKQDWVSALHTIQCNAPSNVRGHIKQTL